MNEEFNKPGYYSIIPANVRYDKDLTPNSKLLYAEITALCNMTGICYASNDYFSKLYNVSSRSIQNWLKELEERQYIKIIYQERNKRIISIVYISQIIQDKLPITNDNKDMKIDKEFQDFLKKIGLKK